MSTDYSSLVSKVWNYAHVLRDQGIGYGDYVEQITFLLFLKMDQERTGLLGEASIIPADWRWEKLAPLAGDELELQYRHTLENLAKEKGLIGTIFRKAQNKLTDPAKLKRVVSLINDETWIGIGVDVKGAIYEGLLEKNAAEVKSGAGQYFTPRPLIDAMVKVMDPRIGETVHDPACGTGGFLLSAYDHMKGQSQDRARQRKLREQSLSGTDIVDEVVRLCGMNLYLHGIGNGESPIKSGDALASDPGERYDVILTNPPFGKKSSYRVVGEDGAIESEQETYERGDFKFTTSNKQLNFMQHIFTVMESTGRAAVVLPDNVLFEAGSAGEGVRRRLLEQFDFHTLLRLPTGIFYKQGVKANVLFFDKRPPRADGKPNSKALWIYDFRTNVHFTLKKNPLKPSDLADFIDSYSASDRNSRAETECFKRFNVADLLKRDKLNLDIFWLKDESLDDVDSLPPPDEIALEIVENLRIALEAFQSVADELAKPQTAVIERKTWTRDEALTARFAVGQYIIAWFAETPSFGRTFEVKILFLAETHLGLPLQGEYARDIRGPYDPWIKEFEKTGIREGWLDVEERQLSDGRSKIDYRIKAVKARPNDALLVLGEHAVEFERMLSLFANSSTEEVEIVATLFAAWNDALLDGKSPTDEEIVREVRENWHAEKARFSPAKLQDKLVWMRRNRLVPTGKLPHTIHQSKLL